MKINPVVSALSLSGMKELCHQDKLCIRKCHNDKHEPCHEGEHWPEEEILDGHQ